MIEFDIRRLIPAFILSDANGYALAKAIEAGMRIFLDKCQEGLDTLYNYDVMPEWRLDELAWEYNVTWYDSTATVAEKRQTIRDARDIYARLGTPDAVLLAFNGVYGAGQVQEWWEYDGEPGHFRIFTVSETVMTEDYERFVRIINAVKNVRSVLDGIYYRGDKGEAELWALTGSAGILQRDRGTASNYSPN